MSELQPTPAAPWQIAAGRHGLPQKFRIDDRVALPDGPVFGRVVGVHADPAHPGHVVYSVCLDGVSEGRMEKCNA